MPRKRRDGRLIRAPAREKLVPVPKAKEEAHILDFLFVLFVILLLLTAVKVLVTNSHDELYTAYYEAFNAPLVLFVALMPGVIGHTFYLFHAGEHKLMMASVRELWKKREQKMLQFRSKYILISSLLDNLQRTEDVRMYVDKGFKYIFAICGLVNCIGIFYSLTFQKEMSFYVVNFILLSICTVVSFWYEYNPNRVYYYFLYSYVHATALLSYYKYDVESYIIINIGIAICILLIVWYFPSKRN